MENSLIVLLVEDEPSECMAISRCIEPLEEMTLVGVTNNADKALEIVKDMVPDAVILDLELHKGSGNGITFLQALKEQHPVPPYILVTTNNISIVTHAQIRKLGVDFILVKSQPDYSAEMVVEFLRTQRTTIQSSKRERQQAVNYLPGETPNQTQTRIATRIMLELDRIGISRKLKGYHYLVEAILLNALDSRHGIYTKLAKQFGKSEASIERAMQNSINIAWKRTSIDELEQQYTVRITSARGVPTLTEFICYYSDKVKKEY